MAEHVVEHDDVGPVELRAPVGRLWDEAGRDLAFLGVVDVVLRLVALLRDLPCNVADQAVVRDEQELEGHGHLLGNARRLRRPKVHAGRPVRNGSH
jgi:hypothetical protein